MTNTQEQVLVLTKQIEANERRISTLERIVSEQSSVIKALLERVECSVKKVLDASKNE